MGFYALYPLTDPPPSVPVLMLFSQDLIVDQTIEKVSFCAPDRNYDKAFSYICRDGTTRRWMCHCFMALKDSVRGHLTFYLPLEGFSLSGVLKLKCLLCIMLEQPFNSPYLA